MTCQICGATTDSAELCRPHTAELEQAIAELPAYLHELAVAATRQTKVYRRTGSGDTAQDEAWSAEQRAIPAHLRSKQPPIAMMSTPLPVDLSATDLALDTVDELLHLACLVGAEEISSKNVTGWLLTHLDDIRVSDAAGEVFDRITYRRRQIERAVDRAPSRLYAGPCHAMVVDVRTEVRDGTVYTFPPTQQQCQLNLYAWPGADEIVCDGWTPRSGRGEGCRTVHTTADRDDWLVRSTNDALLPLDTWRSALPKMLPTLAWPHRSTWPRWAGKFLENRGTQEAPLYRGGDIVDLAIRQQAKIIGHRSERRSA